MIFHDSPHNICSRYFFKVDVSVTTDSPSETSMETRMEPVKGDFYRDDKDVGDETEKDDDSDSDKNDMTVTVEKTMMTVLKRTMVVMRMMMTLLKMTMTVTTTMTVMKLTLMKRTRGRRVHNSW